MENRDIDIINRFNYGNMREDTDCEGELYPSWLEKNGINEIKFYEAFQAKHRFDYVGGVFYDLRNCA